MKFIKDLFGKKDKKQEVMTEAEIAAKKQERKERKAATKAKSTTSQPVKYKKKNTEIRENKPEDFDNKLETHVVHKEESASTQEVTWKAPKKKYVPKTETKETEEDVLFGMEISDVEIGNKYNAKVLASSREGYIVAIDGTFVEATLQSQEVKTDLQIGDEIEVVIYRLYDGIYYASNRRLETISMIDSIADSMSSNEVVSATVVSFNRNMFNVKINDKIDGKVYAGNMDNKFVNEENADEYIGKTYDFAITKKLNEKKFKFELSRTAILKAAIDQVINSIQEGQEITASNLTLNKGGAEFDYNGVRGFIPLREISTSFVNGVSDIPNHIDMDGETAVQVIEIKKARNNVQLVCSRKTLMPSPWNNFIEKYEENSTLEATINEVRHYGFMVDLDCELKTLLHKNNMSTEMASEFKNYNVGDKFTVKIEELDFENNRVNITSSL